MLPSQIMSSFNGVYPSVLVTGSSEGIANVTNLSRVWHVDAEHVAVADQLFHKTGANLAENPHALIKTVTPHDLQVWELGVKYVRSEQEGPLFDKLREDLNAIHWMAAVANPVPLRSAILFQVLSVRQCVEESRPLTPPSETYGDLLKVLGQQLQLNRSSYWLPMQGSLEGDLQLLASRGVPGAGTNERAFEPMRRLAALVWENKRVVRLRNIRSQIKYIHTIRPEAEQVSSFPLPNSFLGFPIIAFGTVIGIVCCEETGVTAQAFDRLDDRFLMHLADELGETLAPLPPAADDDRELLFSQVVERMKMKWDKMTDPFHTVLSARERQVSAYVAKGHTNAEIADILFVSKRTVTTHLERIFQKLQVTSRAALTRYVMEKGLLAEDEDAGR
ncbi:LuxR C-terminal-related transcriptional regulator [Paenibacillus beijingensis]|uniref:LuxR C-terminal-related transcriptional regulator n=1 Tax=Paenibacillus beijingensis TaxID=1126833 RepID=UPI0006991773|nr:LuxR C-terminal-related transcriptional regulator [Paenibacillus beijingensis]